MSNKLTARLVPLLLVIALVLTFGLVLAYAAPANPAALAEKPVASNEYVGEIYATYDGYEPAGRTFEFEYADYVENPYASQYTMGDHISAEVCVEKNEMEMTWYEWEYISDMSGFTYAYYDRSDLENALGYTPMEVGQYRLVVTVPASITLTTVKTITIDYNIVPIELTIDWANTDVFPDGTYWCITGTDPDDDFSRDTIYDYDDYLGTYKTPFSGVFAIIGADNKNSAETTGIEVDGIKVAFVSDPDAAWGERVQLDTSDKAGTYMMKAFLDGDHPEHYVITNPTHEYVIRPEQIDDAASVTLKIFESYGADWTPGLTTNTLLYTGKDWGEDITVYYTPDPLKMSTSLCEAITEDYDVYVAGFTRRPLGSDPSDPYTRVTTMTAIGEYKSVLIGFQYKDGHDDENHDAEAVYIPGNYEIEVDFVSAITVEKRPFSINWKSTNPVYNGQAQLPTYDIVWYQGMEKASLDWSFTDPHYSALPNDPTQLEIVDSYMAVVTDPIIDVAEYDYTATLTIADDCTENFVFQQGAYPYVAFAETTFNIAPKYVNFLFGPRTEGGDEVDLQWGQNTDNWIGIVNNNSVASFNRFQIEYYLYDHDGDFDDFLSNINVTFEWKGILKSTGALDTTYQTGPVDWKLYLPGEWEYNLTVAWMGASPTNYQTSTQAGTFTVTKAKLYANLAAGKTDTFVYDGTDKFYYYWADEDGDSTDELHTTGPAWDFTIWGPANSDQAYLIASDNGATADCWTPNPGASSWGLSVDGSYNPNPIFTMNEKAKGQCYAAGHYYVFTSVISSSYTIADSSIRYSEVFESDSGQNNIAMSFDIVSTPVVVTPVISNPTYGFADNVLTFGATFAAEDIPAEDTGTINSYAVTIKYNTTSADAVDGWVTLFNNVYKDVLIKGNAEADSWPTLAGTYYVRITYNWGASANFYATNAAGTIGDTSRAAAEYVETSFTINQRQVSFGYINPGFVYDGSTKTLKTGATSGYYYINNKVAGDDLDFTVTGDNYTDAGNYTITATGLTGADAANYVISGGNTQDYSIGRLPITVTVDSKTSVYGADPAALTGYVSSGSILAGDAGKVYVLATEVTAASHVGFYDIFVNDYEGEGSRAFCYSITQENKTNSYEVTKKALSITADNKNINYGTAKPELTITYVGFENDDTAAALGGTKTITCAGYDTAVAGKRGQGSYDIVLGTFTSGDYTITTTDGTLTVNAKPITVAINNATSVYGTGDWAALTYAELTGENALVYGDAVPFTLGVKEVYYDDFDTAWYGRNRSAQASNPVGIYFIAGTAEDMNYDITFVAADYTTSAEDSHGVYDGNVGKYTITPKVLTPIWTLNGTGVAGAYTYSGAIQGIPSAAAEGVAGDGTINFTVTEQSSKVFKDAGDYSFIATSANDNYAVSTADDVNVKAVSIAQATLTINWDHTSDLVYDGTAQEPTVNSYSGVLGSDVFAAGEGANNFYYSFEGAHYCGSFPALHCVLTGTRAANYTLGAGEYINFVINQKPLVFSWTGDADDTPFEFTYEEGTPRALTVSTSSMEYNVNNAATDEIELTITYYAASDTSFDSPLAGAPIAKGSYVAKVTFADVLGKDVAKYYTLTGATEPTKSFSIGTKTIAVVWDEANLPTWTYDGNVKASSTYQLASATDGETPIPVTVAIQGGAEFKNAGEYTLVATTSDPNYALSNETFPVSIDKKAVTVNAWFIDGVEKTGDNDDNEHRAKVTYAKHDYVVTATFAGVVDGETLTPFVTNYTYMHNGLYTI